MGRDVRLAVGFVAVGLLVVAVGVGLFDFRAGLIVFGLASAGIGIWHLTTQE